MTAAEQPVTSGAPARSLNVLTFVLATACGLSVANLYYAQPLLDLIARSFHTSQSNAAVVVTATQLGYALGLVVLLPLGDLLDNRKLTSRTLLVTALALALAAVAPSLGLFVVLSVLIGTASVVAQILIPFAAHLAPDAERGRLVGRVMSGLLLGIMLARTVSSLLAAAWGWRSIYVVSAALMLLLSFVLSRMLPPRRPDHTASYRQLMSSLVHLVRSEPALRRRAAGQALMFGTFSAFWTSIAFELIAQHGLSQTGIAIFALIGAAGAAAAPVAGRLGDAGHGRIGSGLAFLLAAAAMLLADLAARNLVLLAVAGVLLDLAVQVHIVLSQQEIYQLRPDARARVNTVFMGTVFLGGAAASAVSGLLYDNDKWAGPTLFGACLAVAGFFLWLGSTLQARVGTHVPAAA
ncbi:MAG: major facilitator superfamily 1 [Frankiales bacterium]|nr:major facilitator superfamily 1 [Frankiales bacterium]